MTKLQKRELFCTQSHGSRGKLTNMTSDSKGVLVELEQVFRDAFPYASAKVDAADYKAVCYKNKVNLDSYFSSVLALVNVFTKYKVLSDIIQLYFTIRTHHKCKIITDSVRAKIKVSTSDTALGAKLVMATGICVTLVNI